MAQGFRPDRMADQIRVEMSDLLARERHDPGVGLITITRVEVTVDLLLALILLGGSTIGAQFGAVAGKRLKGEQIRILLAIIVLVLTVKIFLDLVLTPTDLVSLTTGGGGH